MYLFADGSVRTFGDMVRKMGSACGSEYFTVGIIGDLNLNKLADVRQLLLKAAAVSAVEPTFGLPRLVESTPLGVFLLFLSLFSPSKTALKEKTVFSPDQIGRISVKLIEKGLAGFELFVRFLFFIYVLPARRPDKIFFIFCHSTLPSVFLLSSNFFL